MAAESYPEGLKYYREHDWARVEGDTAVFGITWFAQDALGEIVYVEQPAVGTAVFGGSPYGELESVKAVTDVYAPMSGEVIAVNELLIENPALLNEDCYGDGWLLRVRLADTEGANELMDADAYKTFLETV